MAFMATAGSLWVQESWVDCKNIGFQSATPLPNTAPNACLDSAELLLRPGQTPGVVSMSILLLAHGGRCPQALVPEQGPRASGSSGPLPCRDRKGIRKPRRKFNIPLWWVMDVYGGKIEQGWGEKTPKEEAEKNCEEREAGRAAMGPAVEQR